MNYELQFPNLLKNYLNKNKSFNIFPAFVNVVQFLKVGLLTIIIIQNNYS